MVLVQYWDKERYQFIQKAFILNISYSPKAANLSIKIIFIDTMIMMEDELTLNLPDYDVFDYRAEQNQFLERELDLCSATYCIVGQYWINSSNMHTEYSSSYSI